MNKFRRAVMWLALGLIILLIVLSIYGAFVGAERAKDFFNTVPLAFYWLALALALIVGVAFFRRLVRVSALLLIHLGCVLILAGSIWASASGHKLQKQLFGIDKIPAGQMIIAEGESENQVALENGALIKQLPFRIRLKDFRMEYYEPEYLEVQKGDGQSWKIPVKIDSEFPLDPNSGTVTILRAFENFKITIDGDKTIATDDPQPGYNPALEVEIKYPDGDIVTRYVFERFPGHTHQGDKFLLSYHRVVRDYISELQVIKNNKFVAEKNIEVNHPLHFGGYHFYQHSYDDKAHQYTVLGVVSDTGLNLVYAGYLMLCVGVFWHLWLRELLSARTKARSE
ncbi:MAG: cytochrome c biogenesis protein ResB [Planctomycetota bacterium]|jgi:hypothetical protein